MEPGMGCAALRARIQPFACDLFLSVYLPGLQGLYNFNTIFSLAAFAILQERSPNPR